MSDRPDVDGLNAGYAALVLEQYLDNPASVPDEWRAVFESSDPDELIAIQPGLARLLERFESNGGNGHAVAAAPEPPAAPAPPPPAPAPPAPAPAAVDEELLGGVGRRGWRSSRPSACTGIWRRVSTRSGRSRRATPPSSPSG